MIELVLAVFLSAMIMLGLYAIFAMTFSVQKNSYKKDVAQSSAVLSAKSILRDLEKSGSSIRFPLITGGEDILAGCTNWDFGLQPPLGAQIDTSAITHNYIYCYNGSAIRYRWADTNPPGACVSLYDCANGWPAANDLTLATGVAPDPNFFLGGIFYRPTNNIVELHYVITGATPSFTVDLAVNTIAPNQAP